MAYWLPKGAAPSNAKNVVHTRNSSLARLPRVVVIRLGNEWWATVPTRWTTAWRAEKVEELAADPWRDA